MVSRSSLVGVSPSPGSRVGVASRGCRCPMCSCGPSPARQAAAASPAPRAGQAAARRLRRAPSTRKACRCLMPRAGRRGCAAGCSQGKLRPHALHHLLPARRGEPSRSHAPLSSRMCPSGRPLFLLLPPPGHGMVGGEGRARCNTLISLQILAFITIG
jgi:hypothetical protein